MMRRGNPAHSLLMATLALCLLPGLRAFAQTPEDPSVEAVLPLASKQQMIQDRFQRFQDRVFRLQQQLNAAEPENARRLTRVLEKAGQLALADRLDEIVKLLNTTGTWTAATDAQSNWMNDADQLLDILLERDSESNSKKDEIDRLKSYRKSVSDLLKREQSLRQQSGKSNASKGAAKQVEQAIKRVDALIKQQKSLSAATKQAQGGKPASEQSKALGSAQQDLARKTDRLAQDIKKLAAEQEDAGGEESSSKSTGEPSEESSSESSSQSAGQSAKSAMSKAAQATQQGAKAMDAAQEKLEKDELDSAGDKQQDAVKGLEEAKKALEEAAKILKQQEDLAKQAAKQREVAKDTKELSDQMQANASAPKNSPPGQQQGGKPQQGEQGQQSPSQSGEQSPSQSGEQSPSQSGQQQDQQQQDGEQSQGDQGQQQQPPPPGSENVERAAEQMQKAAESLDKKDATKGGGHQDQAIDELQQAQQQLEEALNQLREEEKEEILRDLEMRFREMLSKQKSINAETLVVDDVGSQNFTRSDKLQIADLSARQGALSQDAAKCGHILVEEGSTIAFPRVVAQLATDMTVVSERLASLRTGVLTQTIEEEIVDTLSQLLEAVKKMQQENEQQQGGKQQQGGEEDQPLLPTSAELKLLRSSQQRVNNRTEKIEWARIEQIETESEFEHALHVTAKRQADCATIAKEMRDRLDNP